MQYKSGVQTDCLYNECIRKDVFFNAKYSLVTLLTFGLFQNRLLDSAGTRIKEEGKLNMCTNSCFVAEN